MTHPRHATRHGDASVTRAGMLLIALLAGACSSAEPDGEGGAHNTSSPGEQMRMHVFACEDGSSILTGMNADTFVVDLVGTAREDRQQLTVPRALVRTADGRLAVMIGNDRLDLERMGQKNTNEHLSFRGKSCWR